jgi:hypothetical protein
VTDQWSFIATDGRPAGGIIDNAAPYRDVKWIDGLDQGNLTCSFPLDAVPAADRSAYFDVDRTVIWPCLNGNPVGAWIVTSNPVRSLGGDTVNIVAQPALQRILTGRTVRSTLIFQQKDQLEIGRDLIRYAIGRATVATSNPQPLLKPADYQAPWIVLQSNLSGVLRDRLDNTDGWQAASRKTLQECMTSLIELSDGFEIATSAGIDANRKPYSTVMMGYPELGATAPIDTLEWPSELVTSGAHGVDGSERVSLVDAIGAGEPPTQLLATAEDTTERARRMPREVARSWADVSVYSTLLAHARDDLILDGRPVNGFAVTLGGSGPISPYQFPWGSRFRFVVEDVGFPTGPDGRPAEFVVRCRGAEITVGGYGAADTVSLQLQVESGG